MTVKRICTIAVFLSAYLFLWWAGGFDFDKRGELTFWITFFGLAGVVVIWMAPPLDN